MQSIRRPRAATFRAAATVAVLLLVPTASARAQLGGLMKKAKQAVAEKTAEKAVDKAADKAGVGHGGGGNATIDDALVQKILAYDAAYVEEYNRFASTDPRFKSYNAARAEYERCYQRDVGFQKAIQRYSRLSEQARLDGKLDAFSKWSDSLSATRMAHLKAVPPGGCAIPTVSNDAADAAAASAAKGAQAKTGTSGGAFNLAYERISAYLNLGAADRQQAISSGAYRAEEAATMDQNRAALRGWLKHAAGEPIGVGADPQAVAKYEADMERYREAREAHGRCTRAAQTAGGTPEVPASMQAQMANVKEPTPAQQKELERLGALGEAAANRGDAAKARIYTDSIQAIIGLKTSPQAQADGQKFAREVTAAQAKSEAAMKKCGVAPDEPIKPAYVR